MNKIIYILIALMIAASSPIMAGAAFDEDSFMTVLEKYNNLMGKLNVVLQKQSAGQNSKGAPASESDMIWLKAEKVNKQLQYMIKGIETAKGVAVALATITNLYNSGEISVDVAASMIQMLKQRAIYIRVFVTNGSDELEVLINILTDHEQEFAGKMGK